MSRKREKRAPGLGTRIMQAALALIYPARCIACDQVVDDDLIFCVPCLATLVPLEGACPRCARPSPVVLERPPVSPRLDTRSAPRFARFRPQSPCIGCL